ncbi:MAG: hypothetical protein WDZ94_01020 [Patescibacteria group bacterium]
MKQPADGGSYFVGLTVGLLTAAFAYLMVGTKRGNQFREQLLTEWQRLHEGNPKTGDNQLQQMETAFRDLATTFFPEMFTKSSRKTSRSKKAASKNVFKGV